MTASAAGTIEEPGRNVAAKSGLNRSMLDVAPYQIRQMLEYKAAWYGGELRATPAPNTSRECSVCGCIHADNRRSQAEFLCVACGHHENADFNASKVIKARGLLVSACGSSRVAGRKQERRVAKRGSSVLHGRE
jgi:putative transposase